MGEVDAILNEIEEKRKAVNRILLSMTFCFRFD